jgi:hypothetical protein
MAKTDQERKEEAERWNNWKPGSGRKGWSPFNKPIPPVRDGATGHPIGKVTTYLTHKGEENEKHT